MRATMAGATNPVGPGFAWVKAMWLDKKPAAGMDDNQAAKYNPNDYEFIPALLEDNPVYADDEEYKAKLDALPNHLRAALLEGRWDVLAGVYFDIFDRATMTTRVEDMKMKPWWPRWISVDWGYKHPAAVHWHCQAESGVTFTYREFVKNGVAPKDLAHKIVSLTKTGEESDRIQSVFLSPDAWAQREGRDSIADQMNQVFRSEGFRNARRADTDRVGGAMLMYQMLRDRGWVIADHCTQIIECIPMMIRDEKNVEDVAKIDGDDPYDSCRYGLKSRYNPKSEPFQSKLKKKLEPIEDPTAAMMKLQQETAKEKRRSGPVRRQARRYMRSRARPRSRGRGKGTRREQGWGVFVSGEDGK